MARKLTGVATKPRIIRQTTNAARVFRLKFLFCRDRPTGLIGGELVRRSLSMLAYEPLANLRTVGASRIHNVSTDKLAQAMLNQLGVGE